MWLFKSPCLRYFLEQVGHSKYFFSSLVCFKAMWVVRFVSVDKPVPQIPQMKNLFISVLIECLDLICESTLFSFLKVFVHWVQGRLSALWTFCWWRLKLIEFLKDFPQELHSRGCSLMCCTIWLFDIGLVETFGQSLHWNCLPSSVCVLKCEVRFALRLNLFSQRSHLKSLESLCWIMWLLRWSLPTKSLLHSWHFVCLSWTCLYAMCLFNVSPKIICWQMSQNTDLTFSQPLMVQVDAELAFFHFGMLISIFPLLKKVQSGCRGEVWDGVGFTVGMVSPPP